MTEQEKQLIVRLWENGESARAISRLLPYKEYVIKKQILELRENGIIQGRSGKSQTKTWEKVLDAYKSGITNPYDLSEMFGLKVGTINNILSNSRLHRKRPKQNYNKTVLCEKTNTILQEIKTNKPLLEIAKAHGVSRQYVNKIKNKYLSQNKQ